MPVAPGDLSDRATGILVHDLERADRIVARAGGRDAAGLPVPLDAADRVPAAWARRAALLAALSALLLLTAVLLYVVTA